MLKAQKAQAEKNERIKKKKHILHYLIIYLVCFLVACITWLSVRYSMQENTGEPCVKEPSPAEAMEVVCTSVENLLYV